MNYAKRCNGRRAAKNSGDLFLIAHSGVRNVNTVLRAVGKSVSGIHPGVALWGWFLLAALSVWGQSVSINNPSFEQGETAPEGWHFVGGQGGDWGREGAEGNRFLLVSPSPMPDTSTWWQSESLPFQADAVYCLAFQAKRIQDNHGTPIAGAFFWNRDFWETTEEWSPYRSYFVAPSVIREEESCLRFGQWNISGPVAFDDASLMQAIPVYRRIAGIELGEGESIQGNQYRFSAPFEGLSTNHSRPLIGYDCTFNKPRWVFSADRWVLYRHEINHVTQQNAAIEVNIGYYVSGALNTEVSGDGQTWHAVGTADALGVYKYDIPAQLFPAHAIWVRFSAAAGADERLPHLQIHGYSYNAALTSSPGNLQGATRFVCMPESDDHIIISNMDLGEGLPDCVNELKMTVTNRTKSPVLATPGITIAVDGVKTREIVGEPVLLPPATDSESAPIEIALPYSYAGVGTVTCKITLGNEIAYRGETEFVVSPLYASQYGCRLPDSSETLGLWWCSSGWKVSRTRGVPAAPSDAMRIQLARNEYEAAQFVMRPEENRTGLRVTAQDLQTPAGDRLPASAIEIRQVFYVPVSHPTDRLGAVAPWPDPLPPITKPVSLEGGMNHPFWVCVHASDDCAPGLYTGSVTLTADGWQAQIPLQVEVFGFRLPDVKTCVTAFGFDPSLAFTYHNAVIESDQRAVFDLYMELLSKHHISPYNPAALDPIRYDWPLVSEWRNHRRDGAENAEPATQESLQEVFRPAFDWTGWDAAMTKAMEHYHFNNFQLNVPGLGGGTFHARTEPSLLGYGEDTDEYKMAFTAWCREVEAHLKEKGWLDRAFVYWFDEPDPKDYAFVMNGFAKLKNAAPGLNRMLTEQIEEELVGGPNIWCPLTPEYDVEAAEKRRAEGDRFWWYVCTGPKAPYATLFIDHPATELRVWLWQTWERRMDGILVWQTNYWHSPEAYPESPQNPYEDPMGWTTGYSTPVGAKRPWGNGDGRFMYPPLAAANGQPPAPVLEPPISSIRLEMLRDGIEDYEYFAMLREWLKKRQDVLSEAEQAKYRALLDVPEEVSRDLTHFTFDPAPMEAHRAVVAKAIETLSAP